MGAIPFLWAIYLFKLMVQILTGRLNKIVKYIIVKIKKN
jgi:hypothetical protein